MPKENITIRLEPNVVERLDNATAKMAEKNPHAEITRAHAIRAAIFHGLDVLERELGIKRGKR